jgi:putative spermidine/putrescine transport system ATP-binding protein
VVLSSRPEHLQFCDAGGLEARVSMVLPLGPSVVYDLALSDGSPLKLSAARGGAAPVHAPGDRVRVRLAPQAPVSVFEA